MTLHQPIEPLHPEGRELSEFERQLWRLRLVAHECLMLHVGLTRSEDRKADGALMFTVSNYSLLLVCKFLEVWNDFEAMGRGNRRVAEAADAVEPLVKRIREWDQVRQYRNWTLAHPYRKEKLGPVIPPWKLLELGYVPNQEAERLLLNLCAVHCVAGVLVYLGDIYRKPAPALDVQDKEVTVRKGVVLGEDVVPNIEPLAAEADRRLKAAGVDLSDPVFTELSVKHYKERSAPT